MYEDYKVYGPYKRKDGRSHVILVHKENTLVKKTISYPKYRMECILNRKLEDNEEVHHRDENVENNEDYNFEIREQKLHKQFHQKYNAEMLTCRECGKKWLATAVFIRQREMEKRRGKGLSGPFCSASCRGLNNSRK